MPNSKELGVADTEAAAAATTTTTTEGDKKITMISSDTTGSVQNAETDGSLSQWASTFSRDSVSGNSSTVIPNAPETPWKKTPDETALAPSSGIGSLCQNKKKLLLVGMVLLLVIAAVAVIIPLTLKDSGDDDSSSSSAPHTTITFPNPENVQWVAKGKQIDNPFPEFGDPSWASSLLMNADATRLLVGDAWNVRPHLYVYDYQATSNEWTLQATVGDEHFRTFDLSDDGKHIVIGHRTDTQENVIDRAYRVVTLDYDETSAEWVQLDQVITEVQDGDWTGSVVRLNADGSVLAVASPDYEVGNRRVGLIRVFQRSGNSGWILQGQVFGDSEIGTAGHYIALSADGKVVFNGSPWVQTLGGQDTSGRVSAFRQMANEEGEEEWTLAGSPLRGSHSEANIGDSLQSSGDGSVVAFNSFYHDHEVYEYVAESETWNKLGQTIESCTGAAGPTFCLSGTGNVLMLACPGQVRVYQYEREVDSWVQVSTIDTYITTGHTFQFIHCSFDGRQFVTSILGLGNVTAGLTIDENAVFVYSAVEKQEP